MGENHPRRTVVDSRLFTMSYGRMSESLRKPDLLLTSTI